MEGPTEKVVSAYLRVGAHNQAVVEFEPTTSDAHFDRIGLYDEAGIARTVLDVRRPIVVDCAFTLERRIQSLELGLAVINYKGERVFYSSTSFADPPLAIDAPGYHRVAAHVPGRVLPPGSYSVNLALHRPNVALYDLRQHILHFDVEETGSGRQAYNGQDIGCVLVDVGWECRDGLP